MDTRAIASEYRLAHWSGIVRERQESGLSVSSYCKQAGFHENIYYYWQRKLREATVEAMSGSQTVSASKVPQPGFAEIRLEGQEHPSSPMPEERSRHQVIIEVSGIRITAGGEYPEGKLGALLREVLRPC